MSATSRKSPLLPLVLSLGTLAAMGALTAWSPTLYDLFCRVTGFGGTTLRAEAAPAATSERTITVRFDANVAQSLAWQFRPKVREVEVHLGEVRQIAYHARNELPAPSWGTATFNVSPPAAGAYFNKIQCFCFTNQELKPGEGMDMPVQFFVDPDILNDEQLGHLPDITLSYTFFPDDPPLKNGEPIGKGRKEAGVPSGSVNNGTRTAAARDTVRPATKPAG